MTNGKAHLQSQVGLYAVAAALRLSLFVFFPSLPGLLADRVEVSTPVNSFKRFLEGLYLYNHNVSAYDGGVYHQAPLLLPLFSVLPDPQAWPVFTYLLYIGIDLLSAHALSRISDSGEAASSRLYTSGRKDRRWSGLIVAALFLFNPYTIATCLGRPTSVFTTCAILHAIAEAVDAKPMTAFILLSFAAYLSMYPILLLPPLLLLAYDRQLPFNRDSKLPVFAATGVGIVVGCITLLLMISYLLTGSWEFLWSTYGIQLTLNDLAPNAGLWWYFFIEMFDSFRSFFLAVFWLHLASYVGGLTIRIRTQPLTVITLLLGLFGIFKPYPSIADTSIFFGLIPLFRHLFPLMRYNFVIAAAMLYGSFLGPTFYHLWIYAGSGNANFFYAITLVWSLGQSLLVSDLTFAALRDEWEVERPEMVGKEIKQI
ncbi:GPI transamidase subunit PIG-U [Microdochium trichocladiopsis]|uniref:GPI transamidase subunit PIG-U n=1 Tax=Microdochium trichocladiopsis TaxID=1682393 RepID=A0A9P9BJR5_9PEZI|nr:GPI transamidase subunit PIG-U [Microdochium trichocladiopsis]KAH7018360.1 GPI transamidase subunit PIG-U [Microdochium trichocladiopsis]